MSTLDDSFDDLPVTDLHINTAEVVWFNSRFSNHDIHTTYVFACAE